MNFFQKSKKALIVFCSLIVISVLSMVFSNLIQRDFGKVEVRTGQITATTINDVTYQMGYKLYIPSGVDKDHPAPALLCLHGYQNDHETSAAYALEAARHGYVALAIDEFGHGSTDIGMLERGYVNHKVTVCYGFDSEEENTYRFISGPNRFKLLSNFSNLDFFIDKYSKSVDKETKALSDSEYIVDASMGGSAAYAWLAVQEFVNPEKMAVTGHSMGTWAAWSVSACFSDAEIEIDGVTYNITPRATILQAGEIFKTGTDDLGRMAYDKDGDGVYDIHFNNVLLLSAKYDEFNYFRDYAKTPINSDVEHGDVNANFLGTTSENASFNKTFSENFDLGTSRRRNLYITNHRLLTHNKKAIGDTLKWLEASFKTDLTLDSSNQRFMAKEWLVLLAMLSSIASAIAFMMILKNVKFFSTVFNGVPNRPEKEKSAKKWWKAAIITVLISFVTYPFLTQLGQGLFPLPEKIFRMTIGDGFLVWYLILIIVMLCFTLIPWFKKKRKGTLDIDFVDLGFSRDDEAHKAKFDWALMGKSSLVVLCGVLVMYIQVVLYEVIFKLDLRFIWPFFKSFSLSRLLQLLVYLPIFIIFFLLNNSKIFASNRVKGTGEDGIKAFFKVWWKYALCMVGGIILVILLEYIPFFLGMGPGADLLFGTTFGGPFMSLLIVFAPQVIVFSFICTYLYRKTGNVFVGAMFVAVLACWIVTGGSAILYNF